MSAPHVPVDTRAYRLCNCWEKQSRTLAAWSYAGRDQAEGLVHGTSTALSLPRGFSQSDRLLPLVHKTSHGHRYLIKISAAQRDHAQGSRHGLISSSPPGRKPRKRVGARKLGRGSQRRKMREAGRLSRSTSAYARRTVEVPTDEALSWKRWFSTLMWYACKKQGHAHIGH